LVYFDVPQSTVKPV